jgi:hypothetical protein
MNKAQMKLLHSMQIPGSQPSSHWICLTCDANPEMIHFRFGMPGRYGMLLEPQDSFLIERIRYRILGKKFKGMNDLKEGLLSLDINNIIVFTIPIQWAARTRKGILVTPNIVLRGLQNNKLAVNLCKAVPIDVPRDCQIAVQLIGYIVRHSTKLN